MTTQVVNVKVKYIRPQYRDLEDWMSDPDNVYIGRQGVVFISNGDGSKYRYPPRSSPFANPFKVGKDGSRREVINKYRRYITDRIYRGEVDLESLRGKRLGCWCKPEPCHGDVLIELLNE